mgnify:CR=1 FL=1
MPRREAASRTSAVAMDRLHARRTVFGVEGGVRSSAADGGRFPTTRDCRLGLGGDEKRISWRVEAEKRMMLEWKKRVWAIFWVGERSEVGMRERSMRQKRELEERGAAERME